MPGGFTGRAWIAAALSLALILTNAMPARALEETSDSARIITMIDAPCGPGWKKAPVPSPPPWRPGRILILTHADPGMLFAFEHGSEQVAQAVGPTPVPDAMPDLSGTPVPASPAPAEPGASPAAATPAPTPTPTLIPISRPFSGQGVLVAPTPFSSSTPFPTPPPLPTPTPPPAGPTGPVPLVQPSGYPSLPPGAGSPPPLPTQAPTTAPSASPAPTLGPNQYAILADRVTGSTKDGIPGDADGNVTIFYSDGLLFGDHAHYDGTRYIDLTGHAYLKNRAGDTVLYADQVRFDKQTQKAYLIDANGATSQGVEQGLLHFRAATMVSNSSGVVHGEHAYITTCENPRGGYHIEGKTLDETPNDKIIIHHATLFLGAFAIFYLPLLLIPLRQPGLKQRQQSTFLPEFGYSQSEGAYVKARIGFAPSTTYYGFYTVEYYTKIGFKLGYTAYFRKLNGKRLSDVSFMRFAQTAQTGNSTSYNFNLDDTENFSNTLRGQFSLAYVGNYGPLVSLPPSFTLNASVAHVGQRSSQNYTFQRFTNGGQQSSMNIGFTDQQQLTQRLSQGFNFGYSTNSNSYAGYGSQTDSFHINTLTHYSSPGIDYDLTFDRTNSATPSGIYKLPELSIRPHVLFPNLRILPISTQIVIGEYSEPATPLATQRLQDTLNFGPILFKVLKTSDFSATFNVLQDAYGTGDLKAQIQQQMSLTTPLGTHIVNALQYNEQNSNGPQFEPFKTLDIIGGASHGATDTIRFFNGNIYNLALSDGTSFNRQAQPISYQFTSRPSYRSSLIIGGSYVPGPGNGFSTTNVQAATPFGRGTYIQISTNVDWKNKGRLESKNIYYTHVIGDCYQVQVQYNQDLKNLNVSLNLLALPSKSVNFGLLNQASGPIIPQSLSF